MWFHSNPGIVIEAIPPKVVEVVVAVKFEMLKRDGPKKAAVPSCAVPGRY